MNPRLLRNNKKRALDPVEPSKAPSSSNAFDVVLKLEVGVPKNKRRKRVEADIPILQPGLSDIRAPESLESKAERVPSSFPPFISKEPLSSSHAKLRRPTPEECRLVVQTLSKIHPDVTSKNEERRKSFAFQKQTYHLATEIKGEEAFMPSSVSSSGRKCETEAEASFQSAASTKNRIKPEHSYSSLPLSNNEKPITDAIISTMLSQNTTDANQRKAFSNLKHFFPGGWEEVASLAPDDLSRLESAIRGAGLSKVRAGRIHGMLSTIRDERGEANFEYLRNHLNADNPDAATIRREIQNELSRFKGMGPKTISCILLFALGIPDFPVDTHVLRISQKMGWVCTSSNHSNTREGAYEYLNSIIPEEYMLDLHCLLVAHGKRCFECAANGRPQFPPKEGEGWECPLREIKDGMQNGIMDRIVTKDGVVLKNEHAEDSMTSTAKTDSVRSSLELD